MKELQTILKAWKEIEEKATQSDLATVVEVRGSSSPLYRNGEILVVKAETPTE